MANSPQVEWIDIRDFRPGIAQRTGVVYPLGQATDDTYRCIANDFGALVPLPARQNIITSIDYNSGIPDYGYKVTGLYAFGPVISNGGSIPAEVFVAVEYIDGGTRHFRITNNRLHDNPVSTATLVSIDSTETSPADGCRGVPFTLTRDNYTDPLIPGSPTVVFAWYAGGGYSGDERRLWMYPDSNDTDSDTPLLFNDTAPISYCIAHQNRVILFKTIGSDFGSVGSWIGNEDLYWTMPNDLLTVSQGTFSDPASIIMAESPTGYGAVLSMSSNELFFVKAAGGGGGYVLGDMDNPTVNNLPNLPSIGTDLVDIAHTPVGTIFPTRYNGVWLFQGGGSGQRVSNNMDEDFWWLTSEPDLRGLQVSWAAWGDWVVGSNNWLFDTETQGWWRFENPTVATYRWCRQLTGQPGRIITAVPNYEEAGEEIVDMYSRYNAAELATNYVWTSQPLPSTIDREIAIKEIQMTLVGTGTVSVIIRGREASAFDTQTFTVDSTYPIRLRQPIKAKGSFIQISVVSDGATSEDSAPEIHRIELGIQPDNITSGVR